MNKMLEDIEEFHKKFDLAHSGEVRELPLEVAAFRTQFIAEELIEYSKAVDEHDIEGQLDALVDLTYVVLGTAYLQGFDFQAAWDEVHSANMRKVKAGPNGEGSKRGSSHDVIKPEGWVGPDHSKIILP